MIRVVFNQKGGVGKSTISTNLAAQSAKQGFKTLLIDLDSQGNSTHYGGVDVGEQTLTVADLFKQVVGWFSQPNPPAAFILPSPVDKLDVMPSHSSLASLERELESRYKMFKLKEALDQLKDSYDHVFIDTPPNFNFYSKAALISADSFIVPFDCDDFSAQAIDRLLDNVLELKNDHNQALLFEGIVINQYNAQARLPERLIASLKEKQLPVFDTLINSSVKVKESHSQRQPLVCMMPRHKVSMQFADLWQEMQSKLS